VRCRHWARIVSLAAQLICSGFARSLRFYTDVLGFTTMRFEPEQKRADIERDGVAIQIAEPGQGELAPLEYPYGRGVTLVIWTNEAEAIYAGVHAYGARLHRAMQEVWREEDGVQTGHAEFEVIDPDGYALRFCQALPPKRRT
jgi:catechol 2,3-dioxygenase-like lactoylglutathione lyase family enzyme